MKFLTEIKSTEECKSEPKNEPWMSNHNQEKTNADTILPHDWTSAVLSKKFHGC